MVVFRIWVCAALAALLLCWSAPAQSKQEKKELDRLRSVQGTISDDSGKPAVGAVVQLENSKTLQIRSFITKDRGTYYFNGLSPDVDYQLKAEWNGMKSPSKTLSSFDARKQATINLKLDK